jgi:1-acyl-sn-glycerol-3-phosphate acyltransferase
MSTLRSVLFTVFMALSALVWGNVVALGRLHSYQLSYRLVVGWVRVNFRLLEALCGLRFRVEGREHLPAQNAVVFLKHSSAYETLAQFLFFPQQCWVIKRELLWIPLVGWGIGAVRPIAIDRGAGKTAVEQVVAKGTARLNAGHWVMIFPEGTRVAAGETRRYGVSGVLLAQRAGRVIVPVAHDAGYYWPRRGWLKRPGVVTFRIGPPVNPAGREPQAVNAEIQAWIENAIAEIRARTDR